MSVRTKDVEIIVNSDARSDASRKILREFGDLLEGIPAILF